MLMYSLFRLAPNNIYKCATTPITFAHLNGRNPRSASLREIILFF